PARSEIAAEPSNAVPAPRDGGAVPLAETGGKSTAAGTAADGLSVVFEVRSFDRGGLESVVADLATGLARRGVEVAVVCTERGGSEVERVRRAGVEVLVLGRADRASELAAWIDAREIDVWNAH